jgi:hypothetical protein
LRSRFHDPGAYITTRSTSGKHSACLSTIARVMWTTSFLPLCTGCECFLPGESAAAVAGRRGNPQHFPPCPQARCLFAQVIHRLVHRMVSQQNSRRLAHRRHVPAWQPRLPSSVEPTALGRRSCPRPDPPRLRRRRKIAEMTAVVAHARSTAGQHRRPWCYPAASAALLRWFSHETSDPSSTRCMPATSASTGAPAKDSVVST